MDSAMLSQLPPKGVYNGKIPCLKHQATQAPFLCPAKLSKTRIRRKGGHGPAKPIGWERPSCQIYQVSWAMSAD